MEQAGRASHQFLATVAGGLEEGVVHILHPAFQVCDEHAAGALLHGQTDLAQGFGGPGFFADVEQIGEDPQSPVEIDGLGGKANPVGAAGPVAHLGQVVDDPAFAAQALLPGMAGGGVGPKADVQRSAILEILARPAKVADVRVIHVDVETALQIGDGNRHRADPEGDLHALAKVADEGLLAALFGAVDDVAEDHPLLSGLDEGRRQAADAKLAPAGAADEFEVTHPATARYCVLHGAAGKRVHPQCLLQGRAADGFFPGPAEGAGEALVDVQQGSVIESGQGHDDRAFVERSREEPQGGRRRRRFCCCGGYLYVGTGSSRGVGCH